MSSQTSKVDHHVHRAKAEDKVSLKTKIGWGMGGLADNYIMNSLNILGLILYVDVFKLNPILAGVAMAIPRFADAITDPIIGNISDNTRSRWGRRRPYIVFGAILSAFILPFLWMPPFLETASNAWYSNGPFWYLVILGSIYTTAYTIFCIPYTAVGFEMTKDYDERSRVLAWRMYIGLGASMTVPWLYYFCTLPVFGGNMAMGARVVCVVVGIIIIITGVIPAIVTKEKEDVQAQETIKIIEAIKYTMTNKSFVILLVAYIIIILGLFSAGSIGLFLQIFYVFDGAKEAAGKLTGVIGTLSGIVSYISLFLIIAVSTRFEKKTAMILGLVFAFAGCILGWFSMDPRWPYAQIITTVITMLGMQGCWLMIDSMTADVCDEDELKTGLRREGMFSAVKGFAMKAGIAATGITGGLILSISGFDQNTASTIGIAHDVAIKMKALSIAVPAAGLLVGIIIFCFYGITRKRAEETRRILDERHAEK